MFARWPEKFQLHLPEKVLVMSKQRKNSEESCNHLDMISDAESATLYSKLDGMPEDKWSDLSAVLKDINAFQSLVGDRALDQQMKTRIDGKMITLENMKNSEYFLRGRRRARRNPATNELISSRKSKKLGVYDHPDPVRFDELTEISSLWEIYASSFLAVVDSLQHKDCAPGLTPIEQRYSFICKKLELVGTTMVVKDSRNPQIVGVTGRVLREGKSVFEIIDPSNKVRTIPKGVCTFEVRVGPERVITIRGVDLLDR